MRAVHLLRLLLTGLLAVLLVSGLPGSAGAQADPPLTLSCHKGGRVGGGKQQFCETRDLALPAPPEGVPLTIDGATSTSTVVRSWAGPDVRVRVLLQSGGDTDAEAQTNVRNIAIQTADNTLRAAPPAEHYEWLLRYEVLVPRLTALVVLSRNGSIHLDDLAGRVEFHARNGNVTLTNLSGYVTGETTNGTLRIALAGSQWVGEGLDVRTSNGTVRWDVPAGYSAQLQLSTQLGTLYTSLPDAPGGSPQELTATLGQGGTLLKASSINGSVYFSQDGQATHAVNANLTKDVERLKAALARADPADANALLAQARRLAYVPGEVVALSALAANVQAQHPEAAASWLQQATQLAPQLRDVGEAGWALSQVGRLQTQLAHQSADLASFYAPVMQALSEAMRPSPSAKASLPSKDADVASSEKRQIRGLRGALPPLPTGLGLPLGSAALPRLELAGKWLDTLLAARPGSPQVTRQLQARRKQVARSQALSTAFAQEGDYAKAYQYYVQYSAYKDSLTAEATTRRLAALEYRQNLLRKEAQIQRLTKEQLLRQQAARRQAQSVLALAGCVGALALFSFFLSRSNRARRRANTELSEQKETLQQALADLKTAQGQLVQSEKMASLGELTAGIAHEIQNPLNFVNNFSEVSTELLDELQECQQQPTRDLELETELLTDLRQNLHRIHQHGHRASAIVKGMLEHARSSSGQLQPTDLNALLAEYGKLAYFSARAKDKTFEAALALHLDPQLGPVPAAAQDISRVLLNIFTNAFYAVRQKSHTAGPAYHPQVQVGTQRTASHVKIQIRDNGSGIPAAIQQKIFQPFFTTKPTGEGTGLGLSLAYDIVTKGHGGTLALESEEGEFTEFTITLPLAGQGRAGGL